MSALNKRAGTLRSLTCRVCHKQFTRKKFQPVCCHACNIIYKAEQLTLSQANLQGANTDDHQNHHANR